MNNLAVSSRGLARPDVVDSTGDAHRGPGSRGGGRRGCHGHGGHGRRTVRRGAARGRPGASRQAGHPERRCLSPRPWRANVRGWRRRLWGGWSSQASPRPRRRSGFARAATTCRRRARDGQRVSPVVPPAGAEVVPAGTADRGDALGGVVGGDGPRLRGQSVSPPPGSGLGARSVVCWSPGQLFGLRRWCVSLRHTARGFRLRQGRAGLSSCRKVIVEPGPGPETAGVPRRSRRRAAA